MLRNFAKSVPLPACLALMISCFAVLWPVVVLCILDQNDNTLWSVDTQRTVYVWSLWTPEVKSRVFLWSFAGMVSVGVFIGIDAALRIKWNTLRIDRQRTRVFFFAFHTIVALAVMAFDLYGLLFPVGTWFTVRQFDYLLLVEGLPLAWFVYSGVTLWQSNARRRQQQTTRVRLKS